MKTKLLSAAVAQILILLLGVSLAAPTAHAGVHYQRLKSFGFPPHPRTSYEKSSTNS